MKGATFVTKLRSYTKCLFFLAVFSSTLYFLKQYCQSTNISFWNFPDLNRSDHSCSVANSERCPDSVVDLRVIVLTYNRPSSLHILLENLNNLELDGDKAVLEVWVDQSVKGVFDTETLKVVNDFNWKRGPKRIILQPEHKALIGQWLSCWNPKTKHRKVEGEEDDYEIGLILEDDLVVSPYAYRWLKGARKHFLKHTNISGITLQGADLIRASDQGPFSPKASLTGPSYMYQLVSSWGLAPNPQHWIAFLKWYAENHDRIKPYVPNIICTTWYKTFEKTNRTHTMWTMWYVYYANEHQIYNLYPNLPTNQTSKGIERSCLAYNRKEPGLHYFAKAVKVSPCLEFEWSDDFFDFREPQIYYRFNATIV